MDDLKAKENKYIMQTYKRLPLNLVKGEGKYVYDDKGNQYLDMIAGLGVNNIGHRHPKVINAVKNQLDNLVHVSNLYYTKPQVQLAQKLIDISFKGKCFFSNSGAEANEAAVKIVRKFAKEKGKEKPEVITAYRSFHGRTLKMLAATGQTEKQKPFEPLPPGFIHVVLNDINKLKEAINENTIAIMLEPVQGEGGVYPCNNDYLKEVKDTCNENNLKLIFDEVQTGLGRTGEMFAYQNYGIEPDIMTLSKSLGAGIPIAATIANEEMANVFNYGDHGTTFGGGPVASIAALETIKVIEDENLVNKAKELSKYAKELLDKINYKVKEIRMLGLMIGIEIEDIKASDITKECLNDGIIINNIGEKIIRLLPPLIVEKEDIKKTIECIEKHMKGA